MEIETVRYNVRMLREAAGLDQKDLAAKARVSTAYVSRLEAGNTQAPRLPELQRVAEALGVTVDDLSQSGLMVSQGGASGRYIQVSDDLLNQVFDRLTALEERVLHRNDARRVPLVGAGAADPTGGVPLPDDEPSGDEFMLRVEGDCLAPDILPGDWLLMSAKRDAKVGDVVSVVVGSERHIKRVAKRNGQLILESSRGRLVLPADGARLEGVMVEHVPKRP